MLLSGSLEVFRIQEVLGLVSTKPGQWLVGLEGNSRTAFVGMRDGAVVSASADRSRQDLARRLVVDGAIGTTRLAQASREAAEQGLIRALVASDAIDPGLLAEHTLEHVVASLAALSHWRSGIFTAEVVDAIPDDAGVSFPLSVLGPRIGAMLGRWRPASDLLGGPTTVIGAHPGEVPPRLRGVHALIDGKRTVAQLIDASGHGNIATVVEIAELIDAGCAVPAIGDVGPVEQRLAMLSALEGPVDEEPTAPKLAVIQGGSGADEEPEEQTDLLGALLRGVRGV